MFHKFGGECPNCWQPVELKKLKSTEGYTGFDLDYRCYARGVDPARLLIARCHSCQYAEYVTDFLKPAPQAVQDILAQEQYQELLREDLASDYPLVALVKRAKQEGPEREGYCYLRASWFEGDANRHEEEVRYLEEAHRSFSQFLAIMEGVCGGAQAPALALPIHNAPGYLKDPSIKARTSYMLAEITRRLGDFAGARMYLEMANTQEFAVLTRDQLHLINKGDRLRHRAKSTYRDL